MRHRIAGVAGKQELSNADIDAFVDGIFGESAEHSSGMPSRAQMAVFARGSSRPRVPEKAWISV